MFGEPLPTAPPFRRLVRGYDPTAVDSWTASALATIASLQAQVAGQQGAQAELVRTMTSAQLLAERLVEETEEEAQRRRSAAASEADLVVTSARQQAHELVNEARSVARRELGALEVERTALIGELSELRALVHDERLRARDALAAALGAVDSSLRTGGTPADATAAETRTMLTVVAS